MFVEQTKITLAPAKRHLEPITLRHLILSGTIDVTSTLIIVPVTINGSKGTVIHCVIHIADICAGILEQYHGTLKDKVEVCIQDVLATQLHKYL